MDDPADLSGGTSRSSGEPLLDPAVESRVRRLLRAHATTGDVGPMPADVAERIEAAITEQARLRIASGPLRGTARAATPWGLGVPDEQRWMRATPGGQRPRSRPLYAAAAVAAAAVVVVAGGSALQASRGPVDATAAVGSPPARQPGSTAAGTPTGTSAASSPPTPPRVTITVSRTAYDGGTLAARAARLLTAPPAALRDGAAEAPALGPIATRIGLTSCLHALGERSADSVVADLATYAGAPAAVVVVTRGSGASARSTAYAVQRRCTTGDPAVLAGPVPLP
ncbi:MAG TPA: hypothetical protein VFJ94_03180 [Intrasporangium sp.]|uniref:hypothetical protein n=1 Tax=Intrasporangium sp. TaxID=1925024 RepID=UPI002D7765AB|nr:hypothetical protein [Intrasporangium sp.]HET7397503.1 hypothetical protein [Intrasporangium sp.]